MSRLGRYWRTVRHLRLRQVAYQLLHRLRGKPALSLPGTPPAAFPLQFPLPDQPERLRGSTFTFLNQAVSFSDNVDWNYARNGSLWQYNLNYFDFLNQPALPPGRGMDLIHQFMAQTARLQKSLDPYPTSLRIGNWICFLSRQERPCPDVDAHLLAQLRLLNRRLEYHLMGNHLLENACALLLGALYFRDQPLYRRAVLWLRRTLSEQILADGGHTERSPMYHQILLGRLLTLCYVLRHDGWHSDPSTDLFLAQKAAAMLGWLETMTFRNGGIPLVNDAAEGIAPTTAQLRYLAQQLNLQPVVVPLSESGYRLFRTLHFELLADVGPLGPDHQPGHGHADTFHLIVYVAGQPVLVDPGTSTYECNARRQWERSTAAHNTVQVAGQDSSEVWKSFRVGRRAVVQLRQDEPHLLQAEHNGYQHLGVRHQRTWQLINERTIQITDQLTGRTELPALARMHFHPTISVRKQPDGLLAGPLRIGLAGVKMSDVRITRYDYANTFNQLQAASCVEVPFHGFLETTLTVQA